MHGKRPRSALPERGDLRADLKRLKRDSDSGRSAAVSAYQPSAITSDASAATQLVATPALKAKRTKLAIPVAIFILLAAVGFFAYKTFYQPAERIPTRLTQITHWNKTMENVHYSPDGHNLSFSSDIGGVQQVFVMLISGGEPLQLTNDEGDKYVASFSADGIVVRKVPQCGEQYERIVDFRHRWQQ
jgi:hypothetical protein